MQRLSCLEDHCRSSLNLFIFGRRNPVSGMGRSVELHMLGVLPRNRCSFALALLLGVAKQISSLLRGRNPRLHATMYYSRPLTMTTAACVTIWERMVEERIIYISQVAYMDTPKLTGSREYTLIARMICRAWGQQHDEPQAPNIPTIFCS